MGTKYIWGPRPRENSIPTSEWIWMRSKGSGCCVAIIIPLIITPSLHSHHVPWTGERKTTWRTQTLILLNVEWWRGVRLQSVVCKVNFTFTVMSSSLLTRDFGKKWGMAYAGHSEYNGKTEETLTLSIGRKTNGRRGGSSGSDSFAVCDSPPSVYLTPILQGVGINTLFYVVRQRSMDVSFPERKHSIISG